MTRTGIATRDPPPTRRYEPAMVPTDLRYTKDHEWVRVDGEEATVGITEYAATQLGDIVFVELPDVGRALSQSATFGVVESVKAVSDLFAPVGGEVVAINEALAGSPEQVNADPYGEGWMVRVRLTEKSEVDELLDAAAYDALVAAG
jgi:glycine cleavage system H protein